jgi:transposase
LALAVDYAGFDATNLVHFRRRLLEHDKSRCVFDAILQALEGKGLVKRRGKQRLDSTHILGLVSHMSRLEMTRETIRLFLQMLERRQRLSEVPGWEVLRERYLDSEIPWRQLKKEALAEKFRQAGRDMQALLGWVQSQEDWDEQDQTGLLTRVFAEQFELVACEPQVRKHEGSGAVKNPHDPEAQWAAKDTDRKTAWTGYKTQIAETVPEVLTTEAIASDLDGRARLEQQQEQHGLGCADTLYVDTAYVTDDTLAQADRDGRQLLGPARPSCNTSGALFTAEAFDVSIAERRAICPAGRTSTQCSRLENEETGQVQYRFEWSYQCDDCPLQRQCTNARSGRRMLVVGQHHDYLQGRRRQMHTQSFQQQMRHRNAIEGTISEFARNGGRRTRYRGLAKTALANYLHGAAINTRRWIRLLQYRMGPTCAAG